MINKSIEQITKDDLQALINNGELESKTTEYKQTLPGNSDEEKAKFLAEVSSFANASGGDLIYGIIEDRQTGKPKSLAGLEIANPDQEKLRLENMIRTGIQPRIPLVTISQPILLDNSKVALIIRVPKSWISPHRVISNDKFYSRNSSGKYTLDVGELNIAFNLSETITERIRNFRMDRIAKILANETPVPFYENAKIVLHLIPVISFSPAQSYDISQIASSPSKMPPIHSAGWNHRYNLDGFLTHADDQDGKAYSYVQLYKNGIIEAVDSSMLYDEEGKRTIPSRLYEKELVESLSIYLSILKTINEDYESVTVAEGHVVAAN